MTLKTDYKDSVYNQKKYERTYNNDGTISLIEYTEDYSVVGDYYGAEDLNLQNLQCNNLNANFAIVEQLISKLRSEGITVSDNSPNAIYNALVAARNNSYNGGQSAGIADVVSYPTKYGYVNHDVYNNAYNTNQDLVSRTVRARTTLADYPAYSQRTDNPSYSVSHNPITAADAGYIIESVYYWAYDIHNRYATWYNGGSKNAVGQLTSAYNDLNV